jgi:hypothetical protein
VFLLVCWNILFSLPSSSDLSQDMEMAPRTSFSLIFLSLLLLLHGSQPFSGTTNNIPSHAELFGGVGRLYRATSAPEKSLAKLENANILVVGIGGVGSWVAEALCRSGVGSLALCDLDDVCVSNINRQVQATVPTVGQMKVRSDTNAHKSHYLTPPTSIPTQRSTPSPLNFCR